MAVEFHVGIQTIHDFCLVKFVPADGRILTAHCDQMAIIAEVDRIDDILGVEEGEEGGGGKGVLVDSNSVQFVLFKSGFYSSA